MYVVGTNKKRLAEVLLMGYHNIYFYGELVKIIIKYSLLTSPLNKCAVLHLAT